MGERFYVGGRVTGPRVLLEGSEAHHLGRVMRIGEGDEVTLFDGQGAEFPARVVRICRRIVELDVLACRRPARELPRALTLGVALPKGERQRWLVEKAVELGVMRLVPLITRRAVAQPGAETRARLERTVIEACKQCGRNRLLEIALPLPLEEYLRAAPTTATRLVAHREQPPEAAANQPAGPSIAVTDEIYAAIGPEGGFTPDEIAAALAEGWTRIDLGPRTLRVETAALAVAALVALGGGPLPPAAASERPRG